MKQLDNYNTALAKLYEYFDFKEDWVVYPIDDRREYYWVLFDDVVGFAKTVDEIKTQEGNYYLQEIYKQRFYKKHVYEGPEFTLIFVNTRTDGMKYFAIYDNAKRIDKTEIKQCEE